ncbi:MAG: lamin tail domain-containing protein [Bacteroidales bacterium]|nr:lamin tail domain-containing protein [Bacteroidales bacterium]
MAIRNKKDGGWSLERVNPGNSCQSPSNWKPSLHLLGGTPGAENTVYDPAFSDTLAPGVKKAHFIDNESIAVCFTETVDTTYQVLINGFGFLDTYKSDTFVIIYLNEPLKKDTVLLVAINHMADLCGNMGNTLVSLIYKQVQPGDLLINEIMARPLPGAALPQYEYIEIYNRSSNNISLDGWRVQIGSTPYALNHDSIKASTYLVLTHPDAASELGKFGKTNGCITSAAALLNAGTTVALKMGSGETIDSVTYTDNGMAIQ